MLFAGAGLHLYDDQFPAVRGNDIQFVPPCRQLRSRTVVPVGFKEAARVLLSQGFRSGCVQPCVENIGVTNVGVTPLKV